MSTVTVAEAAELLKLLNRVRFRVEDDVAEVERVGWRKEQVEILESLSKEKTLHRV
jgi:hypothetical protein